MKIKHRFSVACIILLYLLLGCGNNDIQVKEIDQIETEQSISFGINFQDSNYDEVFKIEYNDCTKTISVIIPEGTLLDSAATIFISHLVSNYGVVKK